MSKMYNQWGTETKWNQERRDWIRVEGHFKFVLVWRTSEGLKGPFTVTAWLRKKKKPLPPHWFLSCHVNMFSFISWNWHLTAQHLWGNFLQWWGGARILLLLTSSLLTCLHTHSVSPTICRPTEVPECASDITAFYTTVNETHILLPPCATVARQPERVLTFDVQFDGRAWCCLYLNLGSAIFETCLLKCTALHPAKPWPSA